MPLNIEVETEHPDVTALKKRVIAVTKKYTDRHGWCSEAQKALAEAGVTESKSKKVDVEIIFVIEGVEEQQNGRKRITASTLAGKTPEQMNAYVTDMLRTESTYMVAGRTITPLITVIDLNEWHPGSTDVPNGYSGLFTSRENGRVRHLIPTPRRVREADDPVGALNRYAHGRVIYFMCSESTGIGTSDSIRDGGRICNACMSRAEANPL